MEIRYQKGPLRFCEVWFNEMAGIGYLQNRYSDADVVVFHESRVPLSPRSLPFRNGILALDPTLDQLLAMCNSGFRNEVRRARKEGILVGHCKAIDNLDDLYPTYARFCIGKQITPLSQRVLRSYAREGYLIASEAVVGDLAVHAHLYLVTKEEAILLASFPTSPGIQGKVTGWANRALHFSDIAQFKEAGVLRYNLGGMGNPVTDRNRAIVAFKNEMRPTEVTYYQDTLAVSTLGVIYVGLKKLIK